MQIMKHSFIASITSLILLASSSVFAMCVVNPGGVGWADSYSANGKCYCATTFDHGIGNYTVKTPAGNRTVRQVCNKIGGGPGRGGNPIYNTVQCGHGPGHNDAAVRNSCGKLIKDEIVCPGRVDQGPGGCNRKGPKWDLSVFNGGGDPGPGGSDHFKCTNNNNNAQQCKSATGRNGAWCNVWIQGPQRNTCFCGGSGQCKR